MILSEFDLIERYFSDCGTGRSDVALGVGDDAALLRPPAGVELAITLDTLTEGVHFLPVTDPESLGHKALAVNLSDLAAMGAEAAWVTLSLSLPAIDTDWLAAFSRGFCTLARRFGVRLVGGDTTRGPLVISVCAMGWVPTGQALRRRGARQGDLIFVSGTVGDAGLGLKSMQGQATLHDADLLRSRLERPQPRLDIGRALRGLASSAIDISDGLAADLGHILSASGVGADIELERLPLSNSVRDYIERTDDWSLPLSAGDDYELCFTLPPENLEEMERSANELACGVTCIGAITREPGLHLQGSISRRFRVKRTGYDHFANVDR